MAIPAWLRRCLIGLFFGVGLAYLLAVPALYLSQRSLIYPAPRGFAAVPAGYGKVSYRTGDGLTLAAAWRPPAPGKPVVLFFHGNGDSWQGGAQANRLLAQAGYGVLLAEYRGYGENPGNPDEAGLYNDARAALGWLAAQGHAPQRVVVIGNSIGSGPASQLASEAQVRALVLISPFSSLPEVVADKLPWLPASWLVKDRYENAAKLGRVNAPVLVLHGAADTMIGLDHARRLVAARRDARLIAFAGFDHDLGYSDVSQRAILAWLGAAR